ncbi:MAG: histidinol dehydrogenase [Chloroflexota bacterium]|nr:histidinol dehydrogenase [Chloroflexota bacterium]
MAIPIIVGAAAGREKILRQRGLLDKEISPALAERIAKTFGEALTPEQAVTRILADVRARGDAALRDWTRRLDRVDLPTVAVSADEIDAAYAETPIAVRDAIEFAATRVRAFHEKQKPKSWIDWQGDDAASRGEHRGEWDSIVPRDDASQGALGQRIIPLARVGVYVPGGTAPLPSSLLMAAIPAQVAGVPGIAVATPPTASGHINPVTLAAAKIVGVSRVYAMGGAQGIAALAFGTETVGRVDKIVGPGGLFVTLAKRQVFGAVGIDGLYGPTETLLIADDSANAAWCAADMLAQAEHDVLATSLLISNSQPLANAVAREIEKQIERLSRREIISQSLSAQGAIIVVENLDEAMELANAFAPEHMCLLVREPWNWVGKVENAGGVFVGEWTNEALGDYVIGPSHVMPTAGTARFTSALNVNDFVKITSVFSVSAREAQELGGTAATLAEAEGLTAHANAIGKRVTSDG